MKIHCKQCDKLVNVHELIYCLGGIHYKHECGHDSFIMLEKEQSFLLEGWKRFKKLVGA